MTSLSNSLLLLGFAIGASSQTTGANTCACSPGAYEITLDFSLFCPPSGITNSDPGIRDISCLISQFGTGATDLVPVSVDRIDILELREDKTLISRNEITGPFNDGDNVAYNAGPIQNTADIPFGIQFNTHAFNAGGEPLLNVLSIEYTNECDVYPVISAGQTAGWLRFTQLGLPQNGFCPAAESSAPSAAPSQTVTPAPTTTPATPAPTTTPTTPAPTTTPATPAPTTTPPTIAPIEAPVQPPTQAPIESPTAAPVKAPVADPTSAPVSRPSSPGGGGMSMSMSMSLMDMEFLDVETLDMEALNEAVEQFAEFGRLNSVEKATRMGSVSTSKSSKKYSKKRQVASPTPKWGSKKLSKRQ